jgi:hypothetical protein
MNSLIRRVFIARAIPTKSLYTTKPDFDNINDNLVKINYTLNNIEQQYNDINFKISIIGVINMAILAVVW